MSLFTFMCLLGVVLGVCASRPSPSWIIAVLSVLLFCVMLHVALLTCGGSFRSLVTVLIFFGGLVVGCGDGASRSFESDPRCRIVAGAMSLYVAGVLVLLTLWVLGACDYLGEFGTKFEKYYVPPGVGGEEGLFLDTLDGLLHVIGLGWSFLFILYAVVKVMKIMRLIRRGRS
uniref:NADH dehydrogenase subunit 6 n=2 Tax=Drepane TaxID=75021 RepID=A0A0U1XMP4_9TELE|nr:NADH dehydrogenase subunit 6 [Drepane punctata]AJW76257.1 NADH dehydrogenase subunit 6 [Drepane longimana]